MMVRQGFALILVTALSVHTPSAGAAEAAKQPARRADAAAGNTQFLLFGMQPAGSYSVRQNGSSDGEVLASPLGVIDRDDVFTSGDVYDFLMTGVQPVMPSRPTGLTATGSTIGCATLSWDAPAASEYVTDYMLLWRRGGTVFTDSTNISLTDIVRTGTRWEATRCGFPNGTYTFAIRAHNAFNLWSGPSNTANATISNDDTQGPPPPTNVAASESPLGCLKVTWTRVGDPTIVGYRMYLGTKPRAQGAYTDSVDVGANASTASRCGLPAGTYYAAVRSYTDTGQMSGFTKEVSATLQGLDMTPPAVTLREPAPGETNVPRNTGIFFAVTDDRSGVNLASISVRVNGVQEPMTGTAMQNGYAIQIDPAADLAPNSTVTIDLTASDRASTPNTLNTSWTFQTGATASADVDPPVITPTSPVAGATGVPGNTNIEVTITDAGLGVALGSVNLEVNGTSVAFTVQGTPASVKITHHPQGPFVAGAQVNVRVEACDRAAPTNCAVPYTYSFTIDGSNVSSSQGDIVPNGYWADDPARPLEVRNLPHAWQVHIFDPAGFAVRRFDNASADGLNWSWDFTNDGGQRVAPALYLVRVTDAGGNLQRSARFVVQSAR
jgi:hypothetical protein